MKFNLIDEREKPASEQVIARGMVEVASELRLVDAGLLVTMIQNGKEASICDLVNSSTEMYFQRDALQYALSSHCSVCWEEPPTIGLDMEFCYENVTAYFRLTIGRDRASVELSHLSVFGCPQTADERTRQLETAMTNARVGEGPSSRMHAPRG